MIIMDEEQEARIHLAMETLRHQAVWYRDQIEETRQAFLRIAEDGASFPREREFLGRAEELENAVAKVESAMGWRVHTSSPPEEEGAVMANERREQPRMRLHVPSAHSNFVVPLINRSAKKETGPAPVSRTGPSSVISRSVPGF